MPGVADLVRKTQLSQEQKARKSEMQELLKMLQEGRLHEADERQLEHLKLALELNEFFGERNQPQVGGIDPEQLVAAVKQAISEGMSGITVNAGEGVVDSSRPQMKHTPLLDLAQDDTSVDISHKEGIGTEIEGESLTGKLDKLRKLKGPK